MDAPVWIGAGGILGALAACWALLWIVLNRRHGIRSWAPGVAMLASATVCLPLVSSSAWLLQAASLVSRAEAGTKLATVAELQRAAYEPLVAMGLGLLFVGIGAVLAHNRWVSSERDARWSMPIVAVVIAALALGGWLLAALAVSAGAKSLGTGLLLAVVMSGWVDLLLVLAYCGTVAVRSWRAA
ncbi:MAG: hypothetical protein ACI8PZ_001118 [Myxococcota bacterium]|jgi:hypothetical protein